MAVPTDEELRGLLDRFVCVRLVQMWGVDLRRFQFDFAMTWAVFLTAADGTIYARYGTRSSTGEQSTRDISLAGFKKTLRGALELHARSANEPDAVRAEVAGKQTRHEPQWERAETIPALERNERLAVQFTALPDDPSGRAHGVGCIHCHMVPNHELLSLRAAQLPIDDRLVWPFPLPGAIGLRMDPEQCATVSHVREGSAAAAAGIAAGDEIVRLDGQTVLSTADLQWVLHNAPAPAELPAIVRRDGASRELTLKLGADWRERLGDWRFTNLGVCMQIAGFQGRPVRGGGERLAIQVARVHPRRLQDVDLRRGDVIVAIDGRREPMNLGKLTRYLLAKEPGSTIAVTRRRRGEDGEKTVRWNID